MSERGGAGVAVDPTSAGRRRPVAPLDYAKDPPAPPRDVTTRDAAAANLLAFLLAILGLPTLLFGGRILLRAAAGWGRTDPLLLLLGTGAAVAGSLLLAPRIVVVVSQRLTAITRAPLTVSLRGAPDEASAAHRGTSVPQQDPQAVGPSATSTTFQPATCTIRSISASGSP